MTSSFDSSAMMSSLLGEDSQDVVYSMVNAQINPTLRRQLENFEDVLYDIEEKTGVEIKFSRKNYHFIGGWSQIIRAKQLLELYAATNPPNTTNSSDPDQDLKSFEIINRSISNIQRWQCSQEEQNIPEGMGQAAEVKHHFIVNCKQEEIASRDKKKQENGDEKHDPADEVQSDEQAFEERSHSAKIQESAGSEQREPPDSSKMLAAAEDQDSVNRQKGEPWNKIKNEAELERCRVKTNGEEYPIEVESQNEPEAISSDVLTIDADVFEYMKMTGKLSELKSQHHINFVTSTNNKEEKETEDIFVTLVTDNEKPLNLTQMLLAQEAFIIEYHKVMQSCAKEVCQLNHVPEACLEEAHAECLVSFPDILFKASPTERNTFFFIGEAAKVKKCRHFFMTHAAQHNKQDRYPFQRSKMAANFNQGVHLQDSSLLQCEEARPMLAKVANSEQLVMQQASSGNDVDPDMPDLEESYDPVAEQQTNTNEQHNLGMARTPASNLPIKDDLTQNSTRIRTAQKSKQTVKPVVELFHSSDDDDDDDGDDGSVHVVRREPDRSSGQQANQQNINVIVKDEDSECLQFPNQWLIPLDQPVICVQCTEFVKQLVQLGCGHTFCLTCVKNKSCVPDMCPECGKRFSREQFHQLEAELTAKRERKQDPKDVPAAKMVEGYRHAKLEFKPEMQEDGTFVQSSNGKLCEQCTDSFRNLIPLKCGHELCSSCYRNLPSPLQCPNCGTTWKKVNLSPPKCEISHIMDKKTHLPHFPKQGSIIVTFIVEKGNDKNVQYAATRFTTCLPNNSDGRNLYKLFLCARKQKKIFEVLPVGDGQGIVLPVNGLTLESNPTVIDKDYLSALEKTLHKLLK